MNISILGSTGSIGTQTLDVVDLLGDVTVCGLSTNTNIELLEQQIRRYRPKIAAVFCSASAAKLKIAVADTDTEIVGGIDGLCEVASVSEADTVVTSIVGIAGLIPTMAAIESGKNLALANKETLVTAGDVVMKRAREKGISILPVDSEHSAIFQCIGNHPTADIDKLIITASGGSFYGKTSEQLRSATVADALNHPNWSMGKKITIDSATLMNKGLEVIEAHHLFGVDYDNIDVLIHRESIVHSMVRFKDGSVLAQLGLPDMRLPIHYALCYPRRIPSGLKDLDLAEIGGLTFAKPDTSTFKCLDLAIEAGRRGGTAPVVLNAANEAAVERFLNGEIKFLEIADTVESYLLNHKVILNPNIDDIIELDAQIKCKIRKGSSLC